MNFKTGMNIMFFFLLTGLILAQGKPQLEIDIQEEKMNMTPAERSGESEINYRPGDTIRYLVQASNVGTGLMFEPTVTDPIPKGTTYIPGSVQSRVADARFSIDNDREYMVWPPMYKVRDAKGNIIIREATPDMVTHIKWTINETLLAEQVVEMEFKVEVNQ